MTEDPIVSRLEILLQQDRLSDAEKVLKELLSEDPNNIDFLRLLAELKLQQDQSERALSIVDQAIGLAPDYAILFYLKARILMHQPKLKEAEEQIRLAITLEPNEGEYFAILAHIKLGRKEYKEALEQANQALTLAPESILALNARSSALVKLDKGDEAFATIEGALREDPTNPYTHANYGWSLLEQGNHKKAMFHFKEALQIDPNFEYAQGGMLEAIKAKNPFYRLFLRYSFWMGNLTSKYQWGVIIGFYLIFRVLRNVARNNEDLQVYLNPILIALFILVMSTWVITPISNVFLRFNGYGKLLLDKKEKMSSSFVGFSLLTCLIALLLYFIFHDNSYLVLAAFGFAMMLPYGSMFVESKFKHFFLIYAITMTLIGLTALGISFSSGVNINGASFLFLLGFIAFQWLANFFAIKESNQ
tara:strand:+ start:1756 stop:3012 length:1257 start_codon:yes stop_codon:yes gene_type:complete